VALSHHNRSEAEGGRHVARLDMTLDDRVRQTHEEDRRRAHELLDFLIQMPPKADARRAVVDLLEEVREDGADDPEVAGEIRRRRRARLLDGPKPKPAA